MRAGGGLIIRFHPGREGTTKTVHVRMEHSHPSQIQKKEMNGDRFKLENHFGPDRKGKLLSRDDRI